MTEEEAIKKLTYLKNLFLDEYIDYDNITPAYDMAVEALEKQIPKKVQRYRFTTDVSCPYCGNNVAYKYCSDCGQRLDWSQNEDTNNDEL